MPAMTDQADIYRAAQSLVERHGTSAPDECEIQAEALRESGDMEGAAVWLLVARAAIELLEDEPGPDRQVH